MKKLAPMLAVLLLLSACRKDDPFRNADCQPYTTKKPTQDADTWIASGRVEGDCMQLTVHYAGCRPDHPFALYWDEKLPTTESGTVTMVLYQLRAGLRDARMTHELHFDLSKMIDAAPGVDSITVAAGDVSSITLPLHN